MQVPVLRHHCLNPLVLLLRVEQRGQRFKQSRKHVYCMETARWQTLRHKKSTTNYFRVDSLPLIKIRVRTHAIQFLCKLAQQVAELGHLPAHQRLQPD